MILPLINAYLNARQFGHWYSTGYPPEEVDRWTTPLGEGALGLFFAPNMGLLVQSPLLFLALVGGWVVWRKRTVPQYGQPASLHFLLPLVLVDVFSVARLAGRPRFCRPHAQ